MALNIIRSVKQMVAEANEHVEEISIADARELVGRDDVLFIDIRDIREVARNGRIAGARHVPRGMLEMWIDPDTPFRLSSHESDVPERAVRRIAPLATPKGWPSWKRPVRMLGRPELLSHVVALLPDHPPRRFVWRGSSYRVVAGDGPERIHGEWWRSPQEMWAVRDYFRVEAEGGQRFWLFRRGDGVDEQTGNLSWFMHGVFG